jgi:ribosomal protein S18 acetylase RimI-like enzyme
LTIQDSTFAWADKDADHSTLADFFVRNVDPQYISHSEMQFGRAIDEQTWNPELRAKLFDEFAESCHGGLSPNQVDGVVVGRLTNEVVLIAVVHVHFETPVPFAVLEDIVVKRECRGQGIATAYLRWIETQARELNIRRLFLESGLDNDSAHHFFEHAGFKQCSIVMSKPLLPTDAAMVDVH